MMTSTCGRRILAGLSALFLAACGGGGDDGGAAPPDAPAVPTTGHYAWLLKAEGRTDNLKFALSLVHPLDAATEVVIEPASEAVTDARVVATATVDVATAQTGALEPYALVYIVGGDVRLVPLRANGTAPASRVTRAQSTSACRFVLDAVDHATPEQSRYVVSTAGADGKCDSTDDGRAEVRLDAGLGLVYTPLSTGAPLAALRDPATLAPAGWLLPTQVQPWSAAATAPPAYRTAADPVLRVVQAAHRSALAESASGLSVLNFAADSSVTETRLPSLNTTGWQSIGHDAQNFYVFRNGGTEADPSWSVQRISRSAGAVTQLGGGAGQVALASMGSRVLYATVITANEVQTLRLLKDVPSAVTVIDRGPLSASFSTVIAGSAGVHLFWRITGLDSTSPNYAVQMIDEDGRVLYAAAPGGFSMGLAEAARLDFQRSENRSRFLFAEGYGARSFADATLVSYDSDARSATRVGQFPGSVEFGNDFVVADVAAGPTSTGAGFAARSINGVLQGSGGTRVFSFDASSANSLKPTTRQQ